MTKITSHQSAPWISIACFVLGLSVFSGCKHHPQPHLDTHATWMNATALTVLPPKSVACPRKSQPYCVGPMYFGHYNECWRAWPDYWSEASAARCQDGHYASIHLDIPEAIAEPEPYVEPEGEELPETTFPPLPSAPLP